MILGLGCVGGVLPRLVQARPPFKRVRPRDVGWPTSEDWARLGRELTGDLFNPAPLLAGCILDPTSGSCKEILGHLQNPYYIGDQPSGTQVSGW